MSTLAPPVRTVVPLDLVLDFDSIGVGTGVVELTAPVQDLFIDLGALRGAKGDPGAKGDKGDKGDQGEKGDPGDTITGALFYPHSQGIPAADWPINHNLGYDPAGIFVEDAFGSRHRPAAVTYVDPNSLILHFSFAFSGTAKLS
jgi:hypothetical protein